jgi:excisionase family DNA binding protein
LEQNFSPKQIAEALRVSESSIKRWCDRGAIQTIKTLGGHRRIPLDSLLSFLESTNRAISDLSAIGLDSEHLRNNKSSPTSESNLSDETDSSLRQYFEDALIRGDEKECRKLLIEWYGRSASFASMSDDLIASTFSRIGELWHNGQLEVFQERRACEMCSRLVHEFRRLFPEPLPSSPIAIGAAAAGDYYTLPGQLVEVVMREGGWRAVNLGANLPFYTILSAVIAERPKLVWLSVSHITNPDKFVEDYLDFWKSIPRDVVVVVGGQALTDTIRPRLRYTAHCDTLQQLAILATTLKSSTAVKQSMLI